MNGNHTERLSQEGECRNEGNSSLLEIASTVAQRVLEEIKALAGTTACRSVQLVRLKKWAKEQGCWFDNRNLFGDFFDRGSENEVYINAARLATKQEIHDEFIRLGFHPEDNCEYYTNGQHDIFDAVDGNVLVGDDGHLYFIDTIIYPSDTGGYDIYRSLSPRAKS